MSEATPTGPNQFRITESDFVSIYPYAVERSKWEGMSDVWIWSSVATFRQRSDAQNYIIHLGLLATKENQRVRWYAKVPRLNVVIKKGPAAVIFHGFDGYDYGGHLVQVRNGVAKIRYRVGAGLSDSEYQTTYLDKEHWHRIKLT